MEKLYTIGFTQKNALEFFSLLRENDIDWVIDIRLNPNSQLSGFAKSNDLPFLLEEISGIKYKHVIELAPTKDLLEKYRKKTIDWSNYESIYINTLDKRDVYRRIDTLIPQNAKRPCLLCSEATASKCHRSLAAEYIQKHYATVSVKHL